jgi:hypothetical protein
VNVGANFGAPWQNIQAKLVHELPRSVQLHLSRASIDATEALLLSFDEQWRWLEYVGALDRFALELIAPLELAELIKALCIGLPRVRGAELRHVGLPNGRAVDLHVFSAKARVHVLLLDVREEVEKTRVWQQSAQETELRSYEKTREIRKQRVSLASLKIAREELSWELALSRAQLSLIRHELLAHAGADAIVQREVFSRATSSLPLARATTRTDLQAIADALKKCIPGQISLQIESKASFFANPVDCAHVFLPLLMFAHARFGTNTPFLAAKLMHESQCIKLSVQSGMHDLNNAESQLLWDRKLPQLGSVAEVHRLDAAQLAIVLCAERLRTGQARITRSFEAELGLYLTMSLLLEPTEREAETQTVQKTRVALAVGARVCFLGFDEHRATTESQVARSAVDKHESALSGTQDTTLATLVRATVQARGLIFEQVFQPESLRDIAKAHAPQAIVLDSHLPGVGKLAFTLRAQGFHGLLIALSPVTAGAAVLSAFDFICQKPTDLAHGLFGS